MNSADLKPDQAAAIREKLSPTLAYLSQLQTRMIERGFPPDDPLLRSTVATYQAMRDLAMELHYLSCPGGVGRPQR